MHLRLREVPLKIWEFEPPKRRLATTHVTFHKTFKLFWKLPLQETASKEQQKTFKKGFYEALVAHRNFPPTAIFACAYFFFIPRCHEKELIAVFKLPTWNARGGSLDPPLNPPLKSLGSVTKGFFQALKYISIIKVLIISQELIWA